MTDMTTIPEWMAIEKEFLDLTTWTNQAASRMKELKDQLMAMSDGNDCKGEHVMVSHSQRRGLIQFKKMPVVMAMSEEELDSFRAATKPTCTVKTI